MGLSTSDPAKPVRFVEVSGSEARDGRWHLVVRDNGVGVPAQSLPLIFQRFTRAHEHRDDLAHITGIGLGLSIVEDCLQALGGRIEVESTEDVGTTFVLTLPIQPSHTEFSADH